jgi:hypothetical protein
MFAPIRECGEGGVGPQRAGPRRRRAVMAKTKRRLYEAERAERPARRTSSVARHSFLRAALEQPDPDYLPHPLVAEVVPKVGENRPNY